MTRHVLDLEQLRNVTLSDVDLMREILATLLQDTAQQLEPLRQAVDRADGRELRRLAHYSKGACASVGANSAADILQQIERQALDLDFPGCSQSLQSLSGELEKLRQYSLDAIDA